MKHLITILFIGLLFSPLQAQFLKDLKKIAEDKARENLTKENLEKVGKQALKDMETARDQFDSTDFNYAILLSDNSGLFDVKEKGQTSAKVTTVLSLGSSYADKDEFTDEENARLNLEKGEFAYASGWYNSAGKRFTQAQTLYEQAKLTENIGYLKTIANQGLLYSTMGRFTQAEKFTVEALELRKKVLGENNQGVASSLNNYGVLHYTLARYHEANQTIIQAIEILKKNEAQKTMPYAIALNNQAMVYQSIGQFEEAEKVLKEAIDIAEKLQSNKSKNHLKFVSNLALLYQQMGKYSEAESLYLSMEKKLGKNSPDYANLLSNLAALYLKLGKDDKVESPLKKSIEIYKSSLGEDSPAYAKAISDLGNFYRYKASYDKAQPLLDKALSIREKSLGTNHPHYVMSQEDMAILHWKKNDWEKAYPLYAEVMKKSITFIDQYFPPMSESEKTKYWDVLQPRFERFKNFVLDGAAIKTQLIEDLFDYQMATKALLLNSTNKIKSAILNSGNKELIKDYLAWLDQKERLARLYAYSKKELKEQKIDLDSMERATNNLERSLSSQSSQFSSAYKIERTSYQQLQKLLLDAEVLVDIIRIDTYDQSFTGSAKYAALVLTKNSPLPKLVILENGDQLETRYAKFYKNAVLQRIDDNHSYEQFWSRIDGLVPGKKIIYLSPDGVYNQINLNTLKKPDGNYFVNQYDLTLISNAKDLISLKGKKISSTLKSAVLLGFPDYEGDKLAPLPGTKIELDGISRILKASGYKVSFFSQKTASETNVKAVKAPLILHIATHGYFLEDVGRAQSSVFGINLENAGDNPLLRSGLLLAGASKTMEGLSTDLQSNDNGVLTAYEAMNLNLEGTDLIVLSACETGLGDIKAGEGVYGLQRAFLVAGADALIMSLWKVDDEATQELMKNFYGFWIKLKDKQKAFKQAQLQLMKKYQQPYYWGAFMMIGK